MRPGKPVRVLWLDALSDDGTQATADDIPNNVPEQWIVTMGFLVQEGPVNLVVALETVREVRAWAAGLIDGEGSIGIYQHTIRPRPSWALQVTVGMTHRPTIERLHAMFGGYMRGVNRRSPRRRLWFWQVSSATAVRVVRLVRPWLVTKAEEADLALRFAETIGPKGIKTSAGVNEIRRGLGDEKRRVKRQEF